MSYTVRTQGRNWKSEPTAKNGNAKNGWVRVNRLESKLNTLCAFKYSKYWVRHEVIVISVLTWLNLFVVFIY